MLEPLKENQLDEIQSDTVFRDVTLLALSGFVAIVLLLLPWLNLKTRDELVQEPVGSVIFELFWDPNLDADIDLWVKGPNDGAVGYSKPSGLVFNLFPLQSGAESAIIFVLGVKVISCWFEYLPGDISPFSSFQIRSIDIFAISGLI